MERELAPSVANTYQLSSSAALAARLSGQWRLLAAKTSASVGIVMDGGCGVASTQVLLPLVL
jgi:hypothetical protein